MASPPYRVKAIFDYSSPHEDDLSFKLGQIIVVTDEEDADWLYGEYDEGGVKQQGLFPRNFVEKYEPATPPRPQRPARPKKDLEASSAGRDRPQAQPKPEEFDTAEENPSSSQQPEESEAPGAGMEVQSAPSAATETQSPELPSTTPSSGVASEAPRQPPVEKKTAPPVGSRGPATSTPAQAANVGSFKDRIAAFNKPAAPPVAPQKPGNLSQSASSGFVKKPYVAPPPSRNAYVPPPKDTAYAPQKRGVEADNPASSQQKPEGSQATAQDDIAPEPSEEQPKPTSLKDRIALLQKQQLEQAARHAEAAQKKEKPRKPPKKSASQQSGESVAVGAAQADTLEHTQQDSDEADQLHVTQPARRGSTMEEEANDIHATAVPRELLSDTNDADQSGGGDTEDGGEILGSQHRARSKPRPEESVSTPSEYVAKSPDLKQPGPVTVEDEEPAASDQDEDQDPEVRRRMELRERMAKMSGGMGMAGMFGPAPGLSGSNPRKPKQTASGSTDRVASGHDADPTSEDRQPVPIMGLPGMSLPTREKVQSPQSDAGSFEAGESSARIATSRAPKDEDDLSEGQEGGNAVASAAQAQESEEAMKQSTDRPVPLPPASHPKGKAATAEPQRGAPKRTSTGGRPVPAPPVPISRPNQMEQDSDDDVASAPRSNDRHDVVGPPSAYRRPPPVPPPSTPGRPIARPSGPRSPEISNVEAGSSSINTTDDPQHRATREPPRPGHAPPVPTSDASMSSPPQSRAPRPPPPGQPPPNRRIDSRPPIPEQSKLAESDEEVTEYEGDYDTDIASSAPRKGALNAHDPSSSADETLASDDPTLHHAGLPSIGPSAAPPPVPRSAAPRAVPPPPPSQPPKRQSSDMPRGAPPPPPPPKEAQPADEELYDDLATDPSATHPQEPAMRQTLSPKARQSSGGFPQQAQLDAPRLSDVESQRRPVPSPNLPVPGPQRQSLDAPSGSMGRRSMDAPRASGEQGFFAQDIDLGRSSQWWMHRKAPPPILQSRADVVFEIEEAVAQNLTVKHVYVMFMDYSQTVITARYDETNPAQADLSQRHEPPPSRLRQDQLEDAHVRFGARLAEMAASKANSVVGNGSAFALVNELLSAFPDALPPVGTRAYGALIYTNMANASVQQHDEIRAGDVVTFRNAKMQGHKGTIKQKYSAEIGKPDHVGIVVDWDGTKKKVRAWEQGRESKKVKMESFKLGDLRSGEVKIWRIVAQDWVGWGR